MLSQDEIRRRARHFLALPAAERPYPLSTLQRFSGLNGSILRDIINGVEMRPDTQRRLSRVFELLAGDQLPDPDTLPKGCNRFKRIKLKRTPEPPCAPLMVLDLTKGVPRIKTEFINPLELPDIQFSKVRR